MRSSFALTGRWCMVTVRRCKIWLFLLCGGRLHHQTGGEAVRTHSNRGFFVGALKMYLVCLLVPTGHQVVDVTCSTVGLLLPFAYQRKEDTVVVHSSSSGQRDVRSAHRTTQCYSALCLPAHWCNICGTTIYMAVALGAVLLDERKQCMCLVHIKVMRVLVDGEEYTIPFIGILYQLSC